MTLRGRLRKVGEEHLPFLLLLGVGSVLYAAVAWSQWFNMDEGIYLSAAATIAHGGVPFQTFAGREPGLMYYLAIGVALFGPNLFLARLQMVGVDLLAATAVYFLGRDLKGPLAGLVSAALFLFNPYSLYTNSTLILEPLSLLPMAWMAYFLLRSARPDTTRIPIVLGLLFAAAELIRRDLLLLFPLVLAVLWLRLAPAPIGERMRAVGWFAGSLVIALGVVLGYFVLVTSPTWMWNEYGLGAAYADQASSVSVAYRMGVVYYLLVYEPVVVIPAAAALSGVVWSRKGPAIGLLFLGLVTSLLAYLLFIGPGSFDWGQGELAFAFAGTLPFLVGLFWLVGMVVVIFERQPGFSLPWRIWGYLGGWILLLLSFYTLFYPQFFTDYLGDISVPLSLLGGLWIAERLRALAEPSPVQGHLSPTKIPSRLRRAGMPWLAPVIVVLVVGSAAFSAVNVLGPSNPYNQPLAYGYAEWNLAQRTYAPNLVSEVAGYLDAHTPRNATLFSADDIFLVAADRANLWNLSIILDHMAYDSYPNNATSYPYDPFHVAPSMNELLDRWNRTSVPLVVIGNRQSSLDSAHPLISWYISTHYHEVATFGNALSWNHASVWALGTPLATPARLQGSYAAGNESIATVVDPANGTVVTGDFSGSTLYALSPTGREWTFPLPPGFGGVHALAFDGSGTSLWVASTTSDVIHYSFLPGSPPRVMQERPVGYEPLSLAFDDRSHLVFVASLAFGNITVLNATTGAYVTTYAGAGLPFALATDPSARELIIGSASEDALVICNETTGTPIATLPIGIPPNNLVLTSNEYLVTSWNPGELLWINRTTGNIDQMVQSGLGSVGLAVNGSVVAVSSQLSGRVGFYNLTSALPMGTLVDGSCPASLSFSVNHHFLYVSGPCDVPLHFWKMVPTVAWTVVSNTGGSASVDGIPVILGLPWQVYPSYFTVDFDTSGALPEETTTWVTASGSWTPPAGDSTAAILSLQATFADEVAIGSVLTIALCVFFLPILQRRPRS